MPKKEQIKLRTDKNGDPIFVTNSQVQFYCHNEVDIENVSGERERIKMRPSQKFLVKFNLLVYDLLDHAIHRALSEDRTDLKEEDVFEFESEYL